METKEILKEFRGTPLNLKELSSYEQWALTFFHNEKEILDPNLDLTLQLDITSADKSYRSKYCNAKGTSFTAYIYWCVIQAMKKQDCFFWRKIDGAWYHFKNLPLTFPIIVGGKERFNDVLIHNVCLMDWDEFSASYRNAIDKAVNEKEQWRPVPYDIWRLSIFIGNQPNLQFTSLSPHKQIKKTGMPLIYFGRRYQENERLLVPFHIHCDHSNFDPYVIDLFLKEFQKMFTVA